MIDFKHETVMMKECIDGLMIRKNGIYVDGTLGGAGHSFQIAQRIDGGRLIGLDKDETAIAVAKERLAIFEDRVSLVHSDFSELESVLKYLGIEKIDGILLDLGCSSYQFDTPERGFSYMNDGPLDMRMNANAEFTAADIVNTYDKNELTEIIRSYGEERWASRIAEFIVDERPLYTTAELVDVIKKAIPAGARRNGPHPAKRTFQALRIEVNDELGAVERAIRSVIPLLQSGGRMCIISFHSLEDRIVKTVFKESGEKIITKRPLVPADEEIARNPRARSAKLRILEKR